MLERILDVCQKKINPLDNLNKIGECFKPFEDSTQDPSYVFYTTRDFLLLVDGTFLHRIEVLPCV
jgi:hypothetical protein